jgi:acetoacetyl-CoA synthetase
MAKEKPVLSKKLWQPDPARVAASNLNKFFGVVESRWGVSCADYTSLHQWSVDEPEKFWQSLWNFAGVLGDLTDDIVLQHPDQMPGAVFYPNARLNFAENLLRRRDDTAALMFRGETGIERTMTGAELYALVSRLKQAMQQAGIKSGDRVAAYLPNLPEAVAAMLATASLGAVWSSCSPDFGTQGVLDRFGQIEPKVLFAADQYFYNGRAIDCTERIAELRAKLPTVGSIIVLPYDTEAPAPLSDLSMTSLADFIEPYAATEIDFQRFNFNHPLYILFSSGTTGVPKCIIHGAGGTLIQHLKDHLLQTDVKPGDRVFYFTTLGWMMWNWLVSGLAAGATILLYDGSPFYPDGNSLFDFADKSKMTHFGTSAKFVDAAKNAKLNPIETHDLSSVRTLMSTGSPLVPESFDFIYENIKADICVSSISGGTDIVGCFVGGNPIGPVWRGEIQAVCLAMDVAVYNDDGQSMVDELGELVCLKPFPSMPVGFWNDANGERYRAAYFDRFPGVWCHGDWVALTKNGGVIIQGRSDATLNPGGVRIGTAEIYSQVEQHVEVEEAIAVGQDWEGDARIILFVRLRDGHSLDEALIGRIRHRIRANLSPRHVPAKIIAVEDIPRTKSGKITELAVRDIIHGRVVRNTEALANPEALDHFRDLTDLRS